MMSDVYWTYMMSKNNDVEFNLELGIIVLDAL